MENPNQAIVKFEQEWRELASEICQKIYTTKEAQGIKHQLQKNGFLSLEEKSAFIDLCDKVKYDVIFSKYGKEDSEGYGDFSESWKQWFQQKGVESENNRGQRSSVDHILFGSTPEPEKFLLHFEEEIMGRMEEKQRE
jgi:hypothetical protein